MSGAETIYTGGKIFNDNHLFEEHSAVFSNGICTSIVPNNKLDSSANLVQLSGDILSVGYADLQVNGGGGVMLNDAPSVDSLAVIAKAHRSLGTTCLLPTLITDTAKKTEAAIDAVKRTVKSGHGSIAGLHLEGPHLSVVKKGAHKAELIRPMQADDLSLLLQAAKELPVLKVTLAPENVTRDQVSALAEAGVLIALGHTNAHFDTCMQYRESGARCVTHLFNAMSQLGSREPGLVGAALDTDAFCVGLIADGVHVHPASVRLAWAAKVPTEQLYLVTDAMSPAGTTSDSFQLNGRTIRRENGRLTLDDGTLAGADIDMTAAIRFLCNDVGVDLQSALNAAITVPRRVLGFDTSSVNIVGLAEGDIIRIGAELDKVSYLNNALID